MKTKNETIHVKINKKENIDLLVLFMNSFKNIPKTNESFDYFSQSIKNIINNEIPNDKGFMNDFKHEVDDLLEFSVRICTECGLLMNEGYVIDAGAEYYCSDQCLEYNMTREAYHSLYDDGEGDSYYTEW